MNFGNPLTLAQEIRYGLRVFAMPFHPQRQAFQSLKKRKALKGLMHEPKSRNNVTRALRI